MSQPLTELLQLLQLERLDTGLYRGQSENLGLPQVYGGQVIGQALSASKTSVDPDRFLHSFHSYFLRPGDPEQPIIYDVEILRDGKSFSTRRIKAVQNGKPIFYLTASYQEEEESFEHQNTMPTDVPAPETLRSEQSLVNDIAHKLPPKVVKAFGGDKPIEVRPATVINPLKPHAAPAKQYLWIRANGEVGDDFHVHQYLLGYAADWGFLVTALQPHAVTLLTPGMKVATIDHSMWFHRPFRMDEWLLFAIESPSASGARGFVRGELFNQQGDLIASATQEGLMRKLS